YQYSLNQDAWVGAGTFSNLAAGNYHVQVQDANGCSTTKDLAIEKANVKPEVNFLVASRKNALDTLVIKEISVPAPDNVKWTWSPQATLLGYDDGTPLIKFSEAGAYWVAMEARFGSCTYSLRKELQIAAYDPVAGPGYNLPIHVIDTLTLSPNPNDGNFRFRIKLNRKQQMVVYVFDMNGIIAGRKQYAPALQVDDQFALGNIIAGTYILRVITENESRDVRFVVTR
ncbi:MAG TPA: T9SS type A sorting domain-containing protein, partial [Chitinophaga sp.]